MGQDLRDFRPDWSIWIKLGTKLLALFNIGRKKAAVNKFLIWRGDIFSSGEGGKGDIFWRNWTIYVHLL